MSNVKKVWNYDEVQALIHLVRKNPSLYDRRAPDYNQTRTKDVSFSQCKSEHKILLLIDICITFSGHLEDHFIVIINCG